MPYISCLLGAEQVVLETPPGPDLHIFPYYNDDTRRTLQNKWKVDPCERSVFYYEALLGRMGYHGLLLVKRELGILGTIELKAEDKYLNHDSSLYKAVHI